MISFLFFRGPTLFPRTLGSGRLNGVWPLIRALFLAPLPVALVVAVLGAVWSWSTGEGLAGAALAVVTYLYYSAVFEPSKSLRPPQSERYGQGSVDSV